MGRKAFVDKSISKTSIREIKREYRQYIEAYDRLTFIEDLYDGKNVKEASKLNNITVQTGHNWLKEWNESGLDSLFRKKGSGRKPKLDAKNKEKLKKIILEKDLTSVRQIKHELKEVFDVEYSERHIRRLMKELGFGYGKPYVIPLEAPNDAEEQLKKNTRGLNLSEIIFAFKDQTAVQNKDNTSRLYYLLGTKNVRVKDTTKLKINGNGFQSPNGNSLILFQPNTKTYEEIRALIQFRMINCQNKEIIQELKNILSDKNLDEQHLYDKLKEENSLEKLINEFQQFLLKNHSSEHYFLTRLKNKAMQLDPERPGNIQIIQKEILLQLLNKESLIDKLKKEKKIVILLDNYSVHRAELVKKACKILNIEFIYLPTHSPHLNPIEQVWKSIKKHMSNFLFDSTEKMQEIFEKEYYRIVNNESFYENWIKKFIIHN